MPKVYKLNVMRRLVNLTMSGFVRLGVAPPLTCLLTVRGRKSGKLYIKPVTPVMHDGKRWLVSPYGEVDWVKNARASGEVTLSRFLWKKTYAIQELSPAERGPILQKYVRWEAVTLPFFKAGIFSPVEAFTAEADQHPVFLLTEK